jgi:YegS/Rv2252/BmrU family lipid kinase
MNYVAIVNPAAGGGRCGELAEGGLRRLADMGLGIETLLTQGPGDATRLAREAHARGSRDFIVVGGDGTNFEVINGLFPAALAGDDARVSLGFLPLGTGNSFLKDFSDRGADHAIEALADGRKRRCDVVRLEHDAGELYFINLFSFGFTADVASLANARFKSLGAAGYGLSVVLSLARLKPVEVRMRLDGGRWWEQSSDFVSINNSRYTGGEMLMAPYAETGDGLCDVVLVGDLGRAGVLAAFPKIFSGTHVHHRKITTCRAGQIEFDMPGPFDLMVDGEVVRARPRRLEVLGGAFDVRA